LTASDFNNDGRADLAIGSRSEDVGSVRDAGSVNVIYGSGSGLSSSGDQFWHQGSPGLEDTEEADDQFGTSLAAGDFDGDGFADLAVGVPNEENALNIGNGGAVNVIYGSTNGLSATGDQLWTQDKPGIIGSEQTLDHFGASVASGDFNGDGEDDLAIGVPGEDKGTQAGSGSVNVLYGSANGLSSTGNQLWTQDSTGIKDNVQTGDSFGASVASGDFNGDSRSDLVVGVPGEDLSSAPTISDAGAVNVIYGSGARLTSSGNQFWHQDSNSIEDSAEIGDGFGGTID
jgi:hypothetical protein